LVVCGQTNALSHSRSFKRLASPEALIGNLIELVDSFNLKQGITNSLDAKLDAAKKALAETKGKDKTTACNPLGAFSNEVQAQPAKRLPYRKQRNSWPMRDK